MKKTLLPVLLCCTVAAFAQTREQWKSISTEIDPTAKTAIDEIVRRIGDKRVVAIGEETHGTADYYKFRYALTRKLIEEKGFTVFVLENPHEDMASLQAGLGNTPLDTLMRRHLFEIYQSAEMKEFLQWLQASPQGKKVKLAGCDDSFREVTPNLLQERLSKYNNAMLNELLADYALRGSMRAPQYYALPGKQRVVNSGKYNGAYDYFAETYSVVDRIDSIYRTLPEKDELAEDLIFHARSTFAMAPAALRDVYMSRDSLMAARINHYAKRAGAKVIVWAHNAHVAKKPVIEDIGRMGQELQIAHSGQFINIGLNSGDGSSYSYIKVRNINADHNFRDPIFQKELLPLKADSWNAAMQAYTKQSVLFDFSRAKPADKSAFETPKPYRFVGYGIEKSEDDSYFKSAPALLYDLVVFIPVTQHTKPIF
ncbi:erythromycin esterase family protein [Chitinophaga caseinilytica]|uniref:erythromycin esterase family protein n=1 Tax=Chitinophaga caseinilytica TaxID=2267521 RepID=UPI003C2BD3DC